jgi:hypothetical protein
VSTKWTIDGVTFETFPGTRSQAAIRTHEAQR